jgi:hypothetical protein
MEPGKHDMSGVVLKGKTHIIERKYKVNGFMKTVNGKMEIEVGAGNNQINPKDSEFITYAKLRNLGDLNIKVRFGKNGKEARTINLGPNEDYNTISIFFTGTDAAQYQLEAVSYIRDMLTGFYDIPLLKDPDYRNTEQHTYGI